MLVSKTGTYEAELTKISVANRGQKPGRCILLYRTVARNGCGIPLSVVSPIFIITAEATDELCTNDEGIRARRGRYLMCDMGIGRVPSVRFATLGLAATARAIFSSLAPVTAVEVPY